MKAKGVYYNENDRTKAAWLRNLIEEGDIAYGHVDQRPIQQVQPDDLDGYAQHHFFAGIGLWSRALRDAGWPDDRPVWTGSCPCGPFSRAGKQQGFADPRHLWPAWFPLIRERRPDCVFGEQSDAASAWIDLISDDLENHGYAVGAPDLPAAGFRGAHIRQRFYWVADADGWQSRDDHLQPGGQFRQFEEDRRLTLRLADGDWPSGRRWGVRRPREGAYSSAGAPLGTDGLRPDRWLGSPSQAGLSDAELAVVRRSGWLQEGRAAVQSGRPRRARVDWLLCRDGRWRPVEPGTLPLVDAYPGRMGLLRGYGDAIDLATATAFVEAYMEARASA